MLKLTEKQIKIIKTCILYSTFLFLGLCVSIVGPCLIDLQHIANTDTSHIALIYTARSVGYLIGSILGGILLDIVKSKQAVITVCCAFAAGTMLGIPWSRSVQVLVGYMTVNGIALGAIENGGNVICLNLWGKDSTPFFQGLHFTYGLGGLISPLIAAPFLGAYSTDFVTNNDTRFTESTSFTESFLDSTSIIMTNKSVPSNVSISRLVYPFTIIGGYGVVNAILLLAVCIISPIEGPRKTGNKKDNSERSFRFMFTVIFLNFFLIFLGTGAEIGYAQMLTTFAVKGRLQLTTTIGSYMTSAFWGAFTLSRLVSVFLSIKLKNVMLLFGDIIITSTAAIILLLLMPNEWALWLASVIFGVGIASFYPSVVGWLNEHINVTNKIASMYTIGASAGEMVIPFIISYFIETIPDGFTYVISLSCILSTVVIFILYIFFKKFDKKVVTKEPGIFVMRTSSISIYDDI